LGGYKEALQRSYRSGENQTAGGIMKFHIVTDENIITREISKTQFLVLELTEEDKENIASMDRRACLYATHDEGFKEKLVIEAMSEITDERKKIDTEENHSAR
jgi:hypothetical protein